ncbi:MULTISPECIES: hypothetical protein [Streptomyces violaceusniger group]|uniref:Major facilitator superfamily (MFS) profile domain-containing protein n=1 Tax=Streptomyces rhizosphaericus TaxID=114699 RepID=A0ABN1RX80_9ACTN|nr:MULTISPECIES: hypothetical protein [Streptomyces violaceusniger group]
MYLIAAAAGGAVLGTANSLTLVATQGVIRPERAGEASGVTKTVITVAAGLGIALAGAVADRKRDVGSEAASDTALQITALGCMATCVILAVWLGAHERQRQDVCLEDHETGSEERRRGAGRLAAGRNAPAERAGPASPEKKTRMAGAAMGRLRRPVRRTVKVALGHRRGDRSTRAE